MITVTHSAVNQIKKMMTSRPNMPHGIKLGINTKGCSGLSYKFSVDAETNNLEDIVLFEDNKRRILVTDKVSLDFIKDAKIDWQESLNGAQFEIDNPLAKSSCGCGSSFSI